MPAESGRAAGDTSESRRMKQLCAWCRKVLNDTPAPEGAEEREITHGICDECISNIEFQQGVSLERFLDSLREPVLLCDDSLHVTFMNQSAAALLGVAKDVFTARRPGQVFECQHARYPQGCGRQIHCSGCAIRMAVLQTAATGRSVHHLPATLEQDDGEVHLLISTEKAGRLVLLRIDDLKAPAAGPAGAPSQP